jgi:transcriptional regulator with XRE-family HTH domain
VSAKLKTLGQILKDSREFKGLLLREVAAAINADTAMISKFEKGERKPTRDQLFLLSKLLGITEREILVAYLSDKIASDLVNESFANEVLKAAKIKIDAIKNKS